MDNKSLLKQISNGKDSKTASSGFNLPGSDKVKQIFKKTSKKQLFDFSLFAVGIFLMYKFGKDAADSLENQVPTEKQMIEMMKQMQGPGAMPM